MKQISEIEKKIKFEIEKNSFNNIKAESIISNMRIIDDLDLDSLDYAMIVFSIEEWIGFKINENQVGWSQIQTINQLAKLFFTQQNEKVHGNGTDI